MSDLNLPVDLQQFLAAKKQLEYDPSSIEPGRVSLKSLSALKCEVVWVDADESPLGEDDPHADDEGYYEVPAVSLLSECEAYDPDFILLWLPNERMFGAWDCDHYDLYVFPGKTWTEIVAEPGACLNAQWGDAERVVSQYFKPYPRYGFRSGRPL